MCGDVLEGGADGRGAPEAPKARPCLSGEVADQQEELGLRLWDIGGRASTRTWFCFPACGARRQLGLVPGGGQGGQRREAGAVATAGMRDAGGHPAPGPHWEARPVHRGLRPAQVGSVRRPQPTVCSRAVSSACLSQPPPSTCQLPAGGGDRRRDAVRCCSLSGCGLGSSSPTMWQCCPSGGDPKGSARPLPGAVASLPPTSPGPSLRPEPAVTCFVKATVAFNFLCHVSTDAPRPQ